MAFHWERAASQYAECRYSLSSHGQKSSKETDSKTSGSPGETAKGNTVLASERAPRPNCTRNRYLTAGARRGINAVTHLLTWMRRPRNLSTAIVSHSVGSPSMMLPPSEPFRTFSTPVNSPMSLAVSSRAVPSAGCRNAPGVERVAKVYINSIDSPSLSNCFLRNPFKLG